MNRKIYALLRRLFGRSEAEIALDTIEAIWSKKADVAKTKEKE